MVYRVLRRRPTESSVARANPWMTSARALDGLRSTVAAHETDRGVIYESAAWITRATLT